jgi:hypothetical protein
LPLLARRRGAAKNLRALPPEATKLLLGGSMSPVPLHKTLVLLETLEEERDERFYRHERLALAKAVVFGISNLHFGPEVGVERPKADAPVVSAWRSAVARMAEDLGALGGKATVSAVVHHAPLPERERLYSGDAAGIGAPRIHPQ